MDQDEREARPQGWRRCVALLAFFAVSVSFFSVSAVAEVPVGTGNPNEIYRFDIEPGTAAFRLNDFSTQSGLQVLFGFEAMRNITITPVHGSYKPFDALDRMIRNTGIKYDFVNRKTVTLRVSGAGPSRRELRKQAKSPSLTIHDRRTLSLEQVEVFAKRARPLEEIGSSVMSISRMEIDALPVVTTQDIVKTLPQVFGGGPTEDTRDVGFEALTNVSRGSGINLRGLGASSTLVLMNGRRLAGTGTQGLFVDVSNVPRGAIESVDILTDSSSTLYGADAVGGVVNIVMREDFTGAQSEGFLGAATTGQLNESYASQLLGLSGEKWHGLVSFDFHSRDNLPAADRALARSDLTPWGGTNYNDQRSNPGNIIAGGRTWAIPANQDGSHLTAGDLMPGAPNRQDRYEGADLLPSQQLWSVFATGNVSPTDTTKFFSDLLFSRRNVRGNGSGTYGTFQVTKDNPFYVNPNGTTEPIAVQYNFLDDLGPQLATAEVTSRNLTIGVDQQIPGDWVLTAQTGIANEKIDSGVTNTVNGTALATALADKNPATAFNPFGDGSFNNPVTLDSLRARSKAHSKSELISGSLVAHGPLLAISGGDIKLTIGSDVREQKFEARTFTDGTTPPLNILSERRRSIWSAFGELVIPLFGEDNGHPGLRALQISAAQRYEHYNDFGDTVAGRFGLMWEPFASLRVRGTYSESFRPPGLLDLDESTNAYAFVLLRESPSSTPSNVQIWLGKNRDLKQENARSWTTGLEYQPLHSNASVALTYFHTEFVDRLSQPVLSTDLLSNPNLAVLITRNPDADYRASVCARSPIAASLGDCLATPITALADLRTRNDASVLTEGFDLATKYLLETSVGKFSFNLNGTFIIDFAEGRTKDSPLVDKVSTPSYPIDLRLRGSTRWQRGAWGVSAYANYYDRYKDRSTTPATDIASWTTFDLQAAYTFSPASYGPFRGAVASLGVVNALNKLPPFVNNPVGIGYDQENGDLTGRIVSLNLRKTW